MAGGRQSACQQISPNTKSSWRKIACDNARRVFLHVSQQEKQGIAKILAKIDDCCENQWKTIKVQHALGAKIFVRLWKEEDQIADNVDRSICV